MILRRHFLKRGNLSERAIAERKDFMNIVLDIASNIDLKKIILSISSLVFLVDLIKRGCIGICSA
jgi:hypothetical protein